MTGWRSLFPNAWYIAAREFRSRVSSKSFIIGTLILAFLAFGITQGPVAIDAAVGANQTHLTVIVRAADVPLQSADVMDAQLNGVSADPNAKKAFAVIWLPNGDVAAAQANLEDHKSDALLIVDRDPVTRNLTFTLRTDLPADGATVRSISGAATILSLSDVARRAGTSIDAVVKPNFVVQPVKASSAPASSLSQELSANLLSTGLIVLIFMAIITYGTWVAMSVAEEKGSRVMELMLNATTPLQMLAGKVMGNGAAGLTQYGIVLAAVVGGLVAQGPLHRAVVGGAGSDVSFGGLSPVVLGAFIVLFVLGFLLYTLLYAALGSLVSRQEDVQSATSPLMMLIMVGYFMSVFGLQTIDEPWVKVASFVPFLSPWLMLARVAVGHVELWEFALSVLLLVVAIAVALVAAARIYSAGVLLYGQRTGLRQVLRAARVSR
jgi:ABC-2 type transport system permease protein